MAKWQEKRLKDIATVITGNTPPTKEIQMYGNKYKFIKGTDITEDLRSVLSTEEMLSEFGFEKYKKSLIPPNTTCIVTIGTLGKKMCLTSEYCFTNQAINAIVQKQGFDGRFIYYQMKLLLRYVKFLSSGTASGRENVSKSSFSNIKIKVPDLPTQERIADILSAYDDLIENNNHRIELLEKAAQDLYKEWFVRFRFPGHETAKFENGLPEGWEMGKFCNKLNYTTGKLDSNAMIENGTFSFYTCAKTVYKTNTYCFDGRCVLLGGNNATGDFSLFFANEKLDAYQRTYIVTPQNIKLSCSYIYFVLKDYLTHFKTASIGATTKFLTKAMLDRMNITIPQDNVIQKFNLISEECFDQIILLKKQNLNLKKQRDLLLPRLMSGKLEV